MKDRNRDKLGLRVGDWVEVRSAEEVLQTLDEHGSLDSLPFMPEMLEFCGRRFRVFKLAHKTCDTITHTGMRRMRNAVHLDGVRCDGEAHGGCEAGCMLFWKEAWLKEVSASVWSSPLVSERANTPQGREKPCYTEAGLRQASRSTSAGNGVRYRCQATAMLQATSALPWWDIRQYVRDVTSGNFTIREVTSGLLIRIFNWVQIKRGGCTYPFIEGHLTKTPTCELNLQPGESVQVKNKQEILATLNTGRRNRGLAFDVEMIGSCGLRFKVLRRVRKIINEKTGGLMILPNESVVLDGMTCPGHYHQFCPRSDYPFWREIWLKRTEGSKLDNASATQLPGELK